MDRTLCTLAISFLTFLSIFFASEAAAQAIDGRPPNWAVSIDANGAPGAMTPSDRVSAVIQAIVAANLQVQPGNTITVTWMGGGSIKYVSVFTLSNNYVLTETTAPYAAQNFAYDAGTGRVNYCMGSHTKVTVNGFWRHWEVVTTGLSSGSTFFVESVTVVQVSLCSYNYLVQPPPGDPEM
jgi:hypothetical protein